jgi:hypothetical protein
MDFTPPPIEHINATPPPSYRLFDAHAVGIATFLGSMFAGAIVVALNEFKLDRAGRGVLVLLAGFVVSMAYMAIAYSAPDSLSAAFNAINIGIAIGAWKLSERHFAEDFEAHEAAGGEVGMRGWSGCLGVVMLVVMLGILFGVVVLDEGMDNLFPPDRTCITYQTGDETMCYSEPISEAQARCTVDHFAAQGLFTGDKTWSTYLDREADDTIVLSMVVNSQGIEDGGLLSAFTEVQTTTKAACFEQDTLRLDLKHGDLTLYKSLP